MTDRNGGKRALTAQERLALSDQVARKQLELSEAETADRDAAIAAEADA